MERRSRFALACTLILGSFAMRPCAQEVLWDLPSTSQFSNQFGLSSAGGIDLNGDGVADIVVGAPDDSRNGTNAGAVRVFSGLDGAMLFEVFGRAANDRFGEDVDVIDDIDGDGLGEVIVGAWGDSSAAVFGGRVVVYSGSTGRIIRQFTGGPQDRLGFIARSAGDVNADGYDDLLVTAPGASGFRGRIEVRSGRSGVALLTIDGTVTGSGFGRHAFGLGDLDRDRHDDIAFVDEVGDVRVLSGRTGVPSFAITKPATTHEFGAAMVGLGDTNGDGWGDFAVGAPRAVYGSSNTDGPVQIRSGLDGVVIRSIQSRSGIAGFGFDVSSVGDIDADGVTDLAIGTAGDSYTAASSILVVSGNAGRELMTIPAPPFNIFARAIGLGDVDADGTLDIAVTSKASFLFMTRFGVRVIRVNTRTRAPVVSSSAVVLTPAGDVDGDGECDFCEGVGQTVPTLMPDTVVVRSARTGQEIVRSPDGLMNLFRIPTGVGDVDGDGLGDVAYTTVAGFASDNRVMSGADGSPLFVGAGPMFPSRGTAATSIGDLDGDGCPELLFTEGGDLVLRSSANWQVFRTHGFSAFSGAHGSSLGDVDQDGVPDYIIGRSSMHFVVSGASGLPLFALNVSQARSAGDFDSDGITDVLTLRSVSNPNSRVLEIVSGSDGVTVLKALQVSNSSSLGGLVGDADFDGIPDFALNESSSATALISGADGSEYAARLPGSPEAILDLDGDGIAEVFVRARAKGQVHDVRPVLAESQRSFGVACSSAGGRRLDLDFDRHAALGLSARLSCRGGQAMAPAVLFVSPPVLSPVPLDLIGAPGCEAYLGPTGGVIPMVLDGNGIGSLVWDIGTETTLRGSEFHFQCFSLDPNANALGLLGSRGLEIRVGG